MKRNMKNLWFKILYAITAIVVFADLTCTIRGSLFTDISQLPKGELSYSAVSPSGDKALNIYVVENNISTAVRGEIVTSTDKYNIFWQTDIETVDAYWNDEKNVVINDIMLDSGDLFGYDCRRGYSLFDEGSIEQNFANYEKE